MWTATAVGFCTFLKCCSTASRAFASTVHGNDGGGPPLPNGSLSQVASGPAATTRGTAGHFSTDLPGGLALVRAAAAAPAWAWAWPPRAGGCRGPKGRPGCCGGHAARRNLYFGHAAPRNLGRPPIKHIPVAG